MAQINVKVEDGLYRRAKTCAVNAPMFFKAWIAVAIKEKVEREEKKAAK